VVGGGPSDIPADGPLVFIANHPYRILDGMMMGNLLDQTRGDFRILANSVFRRVVELNRIVLPILFDE
jgi:putative hemolysin